MQAQPLSSRFCCSADWGLAAGDQRGDFFIRPAKKQAESFGYVDLLGRDYKLSRIFFSSRLNRSIFDHNIARKVEEREERSGK